MGALWWIIYYSKSSWDPIKYNGLKKYLKDAVTCMYALPNVYLYYNTISCNPHRTRITKYKFKDFKNVLLIIFQELYLNSVCVCVISYFTNWTKSNTLHPLLIYSVFQAKTWLPNDFFSSQTFWSSHNIPDIKVWWWK